MSHSHARVFAAIVVGLGILTSFTLARPRPGRGDPRSATTHAAIKDERPLAVPDLTDRRCGCNSLYVYLRLQGASVEYGTVLREVPVSAQGTNLVELRDAASRLGTETAVLSVTRNELRDLRCPVIAHLNSSAQQEQNLGHYVVLTPRGDGGITVIDGTTGNTVEYDPEAMEQAGWSGYVLAPPPRTSPLVLGAAGGVLLGACLSVAWLLPCCVVAVNRIPLVVRLRGR